MVPEWMMNKVSESSSQGLEGAVGRNAQSGSKSLPTAFQWYDSNVDLMINRYERFSFSEIHDILLEHLPTKRPCTALDVGSGTGRDAAALAELGIDVTAVEPSNAVRKKAEELHPHPRIDWVKDSLPKLQTIMKIGSRYDLILLSAVWMHIASGSREKAFRGLVTRLNPGGLLYITLRHGPFEAVQGFWDISDDAIYTLAHKFGLTVENRSTVDDKLGDEGVTWTRIVLK